MSRSLLTSILAFIVNVMSYIGCYWAIIVENYFIALICAFMPGAFLMAYAYVVTTWPWLGEEESQESEKSASICSSESDSLSEEDRIFYDRVAIFVLVLTIVISLIGGAYGCMVLYNGTPASELPCFMRPCVCGSLACVFSTMGD